MLDQPKIDLADQAAEDAQFFRAVLHEMIEAGVDHLRIGLAHAKSRAVDGQADPAEDAVTYDRVTRSVRRNIILAQQVTDPAAAQRRTVARKRIIRDVEDAIHRKAPSAPEREALQVELLDRLDRPDLLEEIDLRPVAAIVADMCRDLGLADPQHPYKRRTLADIALLSARAAQTPQPQPQPEPQNAQPNHPERLFRLVATPNGATPNGA